MPLAQLNVDLCRALGIRDPENVHSVDLQIRPGKLPLLIVQRHVMNGDGLRTAVEMLDLKPQAHEGDGQQKPRPSAVCMEVLIKQAEGRA